VKLFLRARLHLTHTHSLTFSAPFFAGMGAGVAELKDQLVEVKKQLATAAESVELLVQKAALDAKLKAAQAKKSADSKAGGAYGLMSIFPARPMQFLQCLLPHAPSPESHIIHSMTLYRAPFYALQAPRRRTAAATRSR